MNRSWSAFSRELLLFVLHEGCLIDAAGHGFKMHGGETAGNHEKMPKIS
jgi:hypothetical protein